MTQRPKYIAKGFIDDAGKLMHEFLQLNSVDFTDFATVWKKNHFSLIFMGRSDHVETSEFVNEIFRITTQYLFTESFNQKVGTVFLLYALFRNQISNPPVMIRLEMSHWKAIKSLLSVAVENNYLTLHYVINYLKDHAFIYVANQTLKGPLTGSLPDASEHDVEVYKLKKEYTSALKAYSNSNNLGTLRDLQKQYLNEKMKMSDCASVLNLTSHEVYEEIKNDLAELITNLRENEKNASVSERKSKLTAESFKRKTKDEPGVIFDNKDKMNFSYDACIRRTGRPTNEERKSTRPPKEERKVGRPSMKIKQATPEVIPSSDEELDISHLLPQQKDLYLPPINHDSKKNRSKRDPYYQVSPKRVESDTDSDDCK